MPGERTEGIDPVAEATDSIEQLRAAKHRAFTFRDSFEYRAWTDLRQQLRSLEKSKKNSRERAKIFTDIFEDAFTVRSQDPGPALPAFALLDLFERSFSYIKDDLDDDTAAEIFLLQLSVMTERDLPEELRNAALGIWGYYFDPERNKRAAEGQSTKDQPENEMRGSLLQAFRKWRGREYDGNLRELKKLGPELTQLVYLPDEASWRATYDTQADRGPAELLDKLNYFSGLYDEKDRQPLEPEKGSVLSHGIRHAHREGSGFDMGRSTIPMGPHYRAYTLENNRFPAASSLDQGRVNLYITPDSSVISNKNIERRIAADHLPLALLDFLRNRADELRYSQEYRQASPDQRAALRRAVVREFIGDLSQPDSELMNSIKMQGILSAEELTELQEVLGRYRAVPESYLVFHMSFNQ